MGLIYLWLGASPSLAHEGHRNNEPNAVEQPVTPPIAAESTPDGGLEPVTPESRFDPVDFVGRLHPAAVHFPIALLIAAALAEILLILRPGLGLATTVRFLTYGGAAGATIAAALGWFAGGFRLTDRSQLLQWHRWNGTAIALLSLAAAFLLARAGRRPAFRLLLFVTAIALLFQGYWGGELSLGPDHLGLN